MHFYKLHPLLNCFIQCAWFVAVVQKRMKSIKFLTIFTYLLCICGWYYQVHLTSVEYFQHQTTSRISIKTVESFMPPDFSICYWLDYIIDADNIKRMTGKDISKCAYSDIGCMTWFYNHSMDVIIKNFTYDLESRLVKVKFETAEGRSPVLKTYYRYQHKCVRISFGRKLISRNEMSHLSLDFSVYWLTLNIENPNNQTKFENPFITIHAAGTLADIAGTRGIRLNLVRLNDFTFKYKLIIKKQLGAPYDDCYHYRNWKHSKPRCIEECLTREYIKINRTNIARTTWDMDFNIINELRVLSYGGIKYFEPRPGITKLREKCSKSCRTKCIREQYYPSVLSATRATWVGANVTYLEVQANEPVTTIQYVAYFPLLDYFTYLISMPGAWVGISVSSILFTAIDVVKWSKQSLEHGNVRVSNDIT